MKYTNIDEAERRILQQMAEQIDRIVMDFNIPNQKVSNSCIQVLDAETAARIPAEYIECEIINDKPTEL
jgi:hypothetical protein